MRSLLLLALFGVTSLMAAGCCEPEYRPYNQPVYCMPQAQQVQVQPQVCCPAGTVPVQYQ